ncbi:MAG TPA: SMP-30/gluconolactonase/LRE family protein [Chryseosolibacter sp.]|nr:SMP-30/gluconolactonase/LRE family protein [Chryseosolibacter sp.]
MRIQLLAFLILCICIPSFSQLTPTVAFKLPEKELIPEGITYDPSSKRFFVGSIFKQKIIQVTEQGVASDFISTNRDSIGEVLGMKVYNGKLWSCNNSPSHDTTRKISSVHVFDLHTGKLHKRYHLNDGKKHLFNDLVFSAEGDVYVTDSDGGGIYVIDHNHDKLEPFIDNGKLRYPNGIVLSKDNQKVIVSTGSGLGIVQIDRITKEIKSIPHPKFFIIGIDGMYRHHDQLIGIQNVVFPESIVRYSLNTDETEFQKMDLLVADDARFDSPTTGVIVGDYFYFIANSQLSQLVGNNGNLRNPETLNETVILKIPLK